MKFNRLYSFLIEKMEQPSLPGFDDKPIKKSGRNKVLRISPTLTTYHYGEPPSKAEWFVAKFIQTDINTKKETEEKIPIHKTDIKAFNKMQKKPDQEYMIRGWLAKKKYNQKSD